MASHHYLDHADLLTLCAGISDWTERMDFFHSVVDDQQRHVDAGGDILVRFEEGEPDYFLVLRLEEVIQFKCRRATL